MVAAFVFIAAIWFHTAGLADKHSKRLTEEGWQRSRELIVRLARRRLPRDARWEMMYENLLDTKDLARVELGLKIEMTMKRYASFRTGGRA